MSATACPRAARKKVLAALPVRHGLATVWLGFIALATTAFAAPKVEWRIAVYEDEKTQARSTVDLVINDRQVVHVVTPKEVSSFRAVSREEYSAHDVPARALCACTSWWAGAGADLYVVVAGTGRLAVYRRDLDEESDIERYKKVRTIQVAAP